MAELASMIAFRLDLQKAGKVMARISMIQCVAAIALINTHNPAEAQRTIPPIFVSSESDTADEIACNVTHSGARATIEAALRYNRVKLASKQDWMEDRALRMYISLNASEQKYVNNTPTGICAASLDFEFGTATHITNPVDGTRIFATIVFCDKGALMQFKKLDFAQAVARNLTAFVNECVSEYEKKQ